WVGGGVGLERREQLRRARARLPAGRLELRDAAGRDRFVEPCGDLRGRLLHATGKLVDPGGVLVDAVAQLRGATGELVDAPGVLGDAVAQLRRAVGELADAVVRRAEPCGELPPAVREPRGPVLRLPGPV